MASAQTSILIITGGHDFEQKEFFELFDSYDDVKYKWVIQPHGNELIEAMKITNYDVVVFYDMYQEITESQKEAYLNTLNNGKGMVFLHHSLVSYQDWPEFRKIIGGKYLLKEFNDLPKSTYKHDVDIDVKIVNKNHPITKEIRSFQIRDEVYGNYLVSDDVTPLLKTNHPESSEIIGWCHTYGKSRIAYLQSGHDHNAYDNQVFRSLVKNAISWVSAKESD